MGKVSLKNLNKSYGDTQALHDVSLDIRDGEFLVLLGPSGCGKSTTLRLIAGLETITSGDITIDDRIVNKVSPKDRDIAMVFQNYALYPHKNVFDNIAFGLKLRKFNKSDIKQRVEEVADILGVKSLLRRHPRQLSGGELQRVALGRAIVRKPAVFLFDEPLSNLDAKLRVQMRAEIKKLHRKLATTMIYVTHDQVEAMTMGNRIAVLNEGQIMQVGTPSEIFNKPLNKFVAEFIGSPSMNFFGVVVHRDGGLWLDEGGIKFEVPQTFISMLMPFVGQRFVMGVRPEHFTITKDGADIQASLDDTEMIGSQSLLYLKTRESQFTIQTNTSQKWQRGQTIDCRINRNHIHFFDPESGVRIGLND
ncbi:MAG: sn-glycerol-3-phosphate ABC transporter ATP-binding protein UgpC [Bacteroidales bacterium]|nr:sn-glycerol-3-phosphate ABC transporter ATP-binding protein UgpC [Bacteroidales bacterium]